MFKIVSGLKESYSLVVEGRKETQTIICVVVNCYKEMYRGAGKGGEEVSGKASRMKGSLKDAQGLALGIKRWCRTRLWIKLLILD